MEKKTNNNNNNAVEAMLVGVRNELGMLHRVLHFDTTITDMFNSKTRLIKNLLYFPTTKC